MLFQGAVRLAGPLLTAFIVVVQVPPTMLTEAAWFGLPMAGELVVGVVAITSAALLLLADGTISPRVALSE